MTRRALEKRVESLEDERGADPDEQLRYVITRRTVDGELVKKTECYYDENGEWQSEEIDGFNYSIEYSDPDEGDS